MGEEFAMMGIDDVYGCLDSDIEEVEFVNNQDYLEATFSDCISEMLDYIDALHKRQWTSEMYRDTERELYGVQFREPLLGGGQLRVLAHASVLRKWSYRYVFDTSLMKKMVLVPDMACAVDEFIGSSDENSYKLLSDLMLAEQVYVHGRQLKERDMSFIEELRGMYDDSKRDPSDVVNFNHVKGLCKRAAYHGSKSVTIDQELTEEVVNLLRGEGLEVENRSARTIHMTKPLYLISGW